MTQGIIVGLIGIVFLLMWVALNLSSIHQEISAIRKLLSSGTGSNDTENSKHVGNTKTNPKDNLPRLANKLNESTNYEITED